MSLNRVVAITGCDSGLGWSIAARSAREGLITIAGVYNGIETDAAKALRDLSAIPCELDVTKPDSVAVFKQFVHELLKNNPEYKLHAIVNNAGIMTIGEYEWQTTSMIENTIQVNLIGAMRVTSAFLPDLRVSATLCKHNDLKPRVVNVASHCGLQPLPCFAPYSASKAGVLAWTNALRYEQTPYGLAAVAFIPGGFVGSSNLLAEQSKRGETMIQHLNDQQKQFYVNRITGLMDYLKLVPQSTSYNSLRDEDIIETFMIALMDKNPKQMYKVENWRYWFYYNMLKLPWPETVHIWILKKFLNFPEFQ